MNHKALNQLLCAALVNQDFCNTLINNPSEAITKGYLGNKFNLTLAEKDMLIRVDAVSLEDFADQVYSWISTDNSNQYLNSFEYVKFEAQSVADVLTEKKITSSIPKSVSFLC